MGALPADAIRVRDERDRRLAARRALLGDAHAPEDPRGDGRSLARSPASAAPARSATSRTSLDASPQGLQGAAFGYTGIVVAALARYNPLAVVLVGVLIGGLQNAGLYLQGADFPTGLVGVLQGIILFCTLGGELLDPLPRAHRARGGARRRRRRANGRQRHARRLVLTQAVVYGTPILFAALGELLAERSGVLNLGVEGMMLIGAVMGFWAMQRGVGAGRRSSCRSRC